MGRVCWLLVLALLLIPGVAHALQLHWNSGADTLTFTEATRAILVLRADSAEVTLPPEWRLLWVGDSTEVEVVALDSLEVCEGDTAQVYGVCGSSTPEDSTAHRVTAHFCSGGNNASDQATYQLDLPAWGRGKCKVVALDPADSTSVLESNQVTFNGGVADDYLPVILAASSVHQSVELRVTAVGVGLSEVDSIGIAAQDESWSLPLTVTGRSATAVTAVASVAAVLPECMVRVRAEGGVSASARLAADLGDESLASEMTPARLIEHFQTDPVDSVHMQPKDFAMIWAIDGLHVFYIRHDMATIQKHGQDHGTKYTEKNFGHAVAKDFDGTWEWSLPRDTTILQVDTLSTRWDNWHVWAPSIIRKGITYYMFYTGVQRVGGEGGVENQSIGYATSTDLVTWTRQASNVLKTADVAWAKQSSVGYGNEQQLRDPYVMEYPPGSGHYLMYFVAVADSVASDMAVGVARSLDLLSWTADSTYLQSTLDVVVESPHIFPDSSRWWLFFTTNSGRTRFQTNLLSRSPADSVGTDWTPSTWSIALYNYLNHSPRDVAWWKASEHLVVFGHEYIAAFDDSVRSIDFGEMVWYLASSSPPTYEFTLGVPSTADAPPSLEPQTPSSVQLAVTRLEPGAPGVALRIDLPFATRAGLRIYDAAGRLQCTLLDGPLPAGTTAVSWDGRNRSGQRVRSGMYFGRLVAGETQRVVKLPVLR